MRGEFTRNAEDGQHIVDIERKLGEGVYIGTQTMRRCIISIAQGIDGNIYLATYRNTKVEWNIIIII